MKDFLLINKHRHLLSDEKAIAFIFLIFETARLLVCLYNLLYCSFCIASHALRCSQKLSAELVEEERNFTDVEVDVML